jgi:hypothetical protein
VVNGLTIVRTTYPNTNPNQLMFELSSVFRFLPWIGLEHHGTVELDARTGRNPIVSCFVGKAATSSVIDAVCRT